MHTRSDTVAFMDNRLHSLQLVRLQSNTHMHFEMCVSSIP